MSFTDQKPRVATEEDCHAGWMGVSNGVYFRCGFCGYRFQPGDYWRWVFTNDVPGAGGNPMTCKACDTGNRESMIAKWRAMHEEAKMRMWWFAR
jgi:hypothetical protein